MLISFFLLYRLKLYNLQKLCSEIWGPFDVNFTILCSYLTEIFFKYFWKILKTRLSHRFNSNSMALKLNSKIKLSINSLLWNDHSYATAKNFNILRIFNVSITFSVPEINLKKFNTYFDWKEKKEWF